MERARRALERLGLRGAYAGLRVVWFVWRPVTLGVRVMLIRDERVLLVQHTYRGGWFLPGGGLKRRETLEEGARREALEETGTRAGPLLLLGIYTSFGEHKSDHVAVFVCTEFERELGVHDEEIACVEEFPLDALPPGAARGTARVIADYRAGNGPYLGRW